MSRDVRYVSVAAAIAACVATVVLIWHAWHYFFLYDDFALVAIAGGTSSWLLATTPQIGFFRPLPFLIMRAEFLLVHWTPASAYASVGVFIHVLNATLVGVLAREIGLRKQLAFTAGVLFLLSASSGEGYFWVSSMFDRLCAFGTLLALVGGVLALRAPSERGACSWGSVGLLGTVIALLSKESGVVIPAMTLAMFTMAGMSIRRRAIVYVALQSLPVLLLLGYRQQLLPSFGGAYGPLSTLFQKANVPGNIISYAVSFSHSPLPWHETTWFVGHLCTIALASSAASWLVVLVALGVRRPAMLSGGLVAALLAIAPVAWVRVLPGLTASGRFLYLPGIVVALLPAFAVDVAEAQERGRLRSITKAAMIVILSVQSASVLYQAQIWRLGSELSRQTMEEMRPYAKFQRPLYIANMPAVFIEGPFILKAYAFPFYFESTFKPLIRVRSLAAKVVNGRPVFSNWMDPDDHRPEERVVVLHVFDTPSHTR